ncbi:MAG: GAF domain-containing protein, partial [Gemmatimonadota bacterium]
MSDRTFRTTGRLTPGAEVDLEACHTDPIHRTARIQPHGTFLEVDPDEHTVLSAAENLEPYLGCPAEEAIGLPITELFASASLERIGRWPRGTGQSTERYVFEEGGRSLSVTLFPVGESSGVEVERPGGDEEVAEEVVLNARPVLDRLRGLTERDELFDETVAAVRSVSGFDRVMLYRFDEQGHGQVVAEDRRPDVASYLDQHFPASDIPEPARRLYRKNRVRHIPDVEYDPVPILGPEGPRDRSEMDLTHSSLRAVPEVHCQYLRNMGVRASTSISVLVEGELWGLIACHGLEPRLLGWARRNICELVGHTVSQQIARIRAEEQERRLRTVERFSGRFRAPDDVDDLFAQLESERSELLSLLDAGGFYLQL